ncbi:MAG: BON domain-containing protein, partial [Planctomycetota bacterium]
MRIAVAVAALLTLPAATTLAQGQGTTGGGSSLFGSGSTLFGGGGGGGQGGLGGSGLNAGAQGPGANQQFTLNQEGGSGGFVGRDSSDTGAVFQGLNPGGDQVLNQIERAFRARNRGRDANQSADARPPIRVQLKLGFKPLVASENLAAPTTQRLNGMFAEQGFAAARAEVSAAQVVLTGTVATDSQRRMLARLARLEPAVRRVENQLGSLALKESFAHNTACRFTANWGSN